MKRSKQPISESSESDSESDSDWSSDASLAKGLEAHSESADDSDASNSSEAGSSIVNIDFDFTSLHAASIPHYCQLVKNMLAPIIVATGPCFAVEVVEAFSTFLKEGTVEKQVWLSEQKGTAIVQSEELSSNSDSDSEANEPNSTDLEKLKSIEKMPSAIWPLAFLSVVPLQALHLQPNQRAVFEAWLADSSLAAKGACTLRNTDWIIKCASVNNLPTELLFPLYHSLFPEDQMNQRGYYLILVRTLTFISENENKVKKKKQTRLPKVDYFFPEDNLLESSSLAFMDLKVTDLSTMAASDSSTLPSKGFEDMEYVEGRRLFLISSAQLLTYVQTLKSEFGTSHAE